jgi:F0F1-type ATP synthase membrane subunit b/b'
VIEQDLQELARAIAQREKDSSAREIQLIIERADLAMEQADDKYRQSLRKERNRADKAGNTIRHLTTVTL